MPVVLAEQLFRHRYYTNWAQYRPEGQQFFPENIDATKFTHICYAFARVTLDYEVEPFEWNDVVGWDASQGMYNRFHAHVRAQNPAIKTLISLGGWNFGSTIFSPMSMSTTHRKTFIDSAIAFCREHGFDGVDIDWEYPGAAEKDYYAALLSEFRAALEAEARSTNQPLLLLTVAVPAGEAQINAGYDVATVAAAVDWIGVMAYDLHGSWETTVGAHTALFSSNGQRDTLTVSHALKVWEGKGAPASKLIVGIATYGRGWTLNDESQHDMGAKAHGASTAGRFTREMGFLSYYEIRTMLNQSHAVETFDYETETMYAHAGNQWVGFDNPTTVRIKTQYIKDHGYGGGMVWALDLDDFNNGYPIVTAVAELMMDKH